MAGKARSRNYPVFGLGEAIKRARELYDSDGKAAVDTDVAVQAWGYKSLNGASLRTLGAVRQYGLLDNAGNKQVRLSPNALTILLEPLDSVERAEAIANAAAAPTMFREIRDQYPDGLPSDSGIISWLVRNHTFNEGAARDLVAAYRSTLELVGDLARSEHKAGASAISQSPADQKAVDEERRSPDHRQGQARSAGTGGVMEFNWPLSGEAVATLVVTKGLEEDDIETLSAYFEIAKKALAKASIASRNPGHPPDRGAAGDGTG